MIREGIVLFRVQHFEQRCWRIALKIRIEFVDFIEHKDGIDGFGFAHCLQDAARQGAQIGAPMPTDLSFIVHAP